MSRARAAGAPLDRRATVRAIGRIAARELVEAGRSRFTWAMAILLAALPLLVSALGLGVHGGLALQGFARTSASLINLNLYLVPLFGVLMAHASVVGEAERGTLRMLAAQPIARRWVVVGKFLGLGALTSSLVGGSLAFGGVLVALRAGVEHLGDYAILIGSAVLLGFSFTAIGLWLSTVARDRAQALAASFGAWFLFVIVLDLALLALFIALSRLFIAPDYAPSVELLHRELAAGQSGSQVRFPWISGLLLLNPTDVFRLANVLRVPAVRQVMALTRSLPGWLASGWTLGLAALFWIAAPLWAAIRRFERMDVE